MAVIVYPRETQEMVLAAHNQAFAFLGGVPKCMVYDNMKTVAYAIFAGKKRHFNRCFLTLANHYLFEPSLYASILEEKLGGKSGR